MRGGRPLGIGSLISGALKALDLETRVREHTCVLLWDEVVGEKVAAAAQPEFIRDGRMFVVTKSSVWAGELSMYKHDIIARLNRRAGGTALKEIIFKAGRMPAKSGGRATPSVEAPDLEGFELTEEELQRVRGVALSAGEEASGAIQGLLETALRLEKWKESRGWTPCRRCGALQNTTTGICPVCEIENLE